MKFVLRNNLFLWFFVMASLLLPAFICQASSNVASLWRENSSPVVQFSPLVHTEELTDMALFFINSLLIIIGVFAISIIFISSVNIFLASGNVDSIQKAKYSLISGLLVLLFTSVLYFSLGSVVTIVQSLASNMV